MKRTLLLLALTGISTLAFADRNSNDAAVRAANEARQADRAATNGNSGSVTYVATSNGKGGTSFVAVRDQAMTSIALSKTMASKGDSCSGGACCAKH